jgi:hypothetical protein
MVPWFAGSLVPWFPGSLVRLLFALCSLFFCSHKVKNHAQPNHPPAALTAH